MRLKFFVRNQRYNDIFSAYRDANCNQDRAQQTNLTHNQCEGLWKLKKHVKEEEIVIVKSDKTDKPIAVSREAYKQMGMVHIGNDKVILNVEAMEI